MTPATPAARVPERHSLPDAEAAMTPSEPSGGVRLTHRSGSSKLRELPLADMVATVPPPVPWVVDRIVMRGGLTLLAGVPGQGKSLVAMAFSIAATRDHSSALAGIMVEPCRVAIVDAENGPNEIHRRIHALGLATEAVERMTVFDADGFDLASDLAHLDELLARVRPSLLVLDSFRSIWRGDERDEAAVASVLDPLRNLVRSHGAGTLLIHHARRDGSGYRGSGAIAASCELAFILDRESDDPEPLRRRLRCEKSRPAPEPDPRWLQLASDAELATGLPLIAEAEPCAPSNGTRSSTQSDIADQAVRLIATCGALIASDVARELKREPTDGTVRRALVMAVSDGRLIRRDDKRYALAGHDGNPAGNPDNGLASQPTP